VAAAPPFDSTKWNSSDAIRLHNNCYNYASDKITNTFAQPGKGSGQEGPYPPTCPDTGQAAVRDGQIVVKNPDVSPADGQIIALVVSSAPGFSTTTGIGVTRMVCGRISLDKLRRKIQTTLGGQYLTQKPVIVALTIYSVVISTAFLLKLRFGDFPT
jgi:uncharacterized protein (DUF2141 family)